MQSDTSPLLLPKQLLSALGITKIPDDTTSLYSLFQQLARTLTLLVTTRQPKTFRHTLQEYFKLDEYHIDRVISDFHTQIPLSGSPPLPAPTTAPSLVPFAIHLIIVSTSYLCSVSSPFGSPFSSPFGSPLSSPLLSYLQTPLPSKKEDDSGDKHRKINKLSKQIIYIVDSKVVSFSKNVISYNKPGPFRTVVVTIGGVLKSVCFKFFCESSLSSIFSIL